MAMKRFLILFMVAVAVLPSVVVAQQRDQSRIKRERQAAERTIKETSRKINANKAETKKKQGALKKLHTEIKDKDREIVQLEASVAAIDASIAVASDSLAMLEGEYNRMRSAYVTALRKMQLSRNSMNPVAYVFSSGTVRQAINRVRYLRRFEQWRSRRSVEINESLLRINAARERLGGLYESRSASLGLLSQARSKLEIEREETNRDVNRLKREGKSLEASLAKSQKKLRSLDAELDRLIAEQAKKRREQSAGKQSGKKGTKSAAGKREITGISDADRALSGSFESNRGRLLFPVAGRYKITKGFGRQPHPELPHVETENSGIDIGVSGGTSARAIFNGTVSAIFRQPGFNTVVMVRHGSYISIYANLSSISVKTGDKVSTGQSIGVIGVDPDGGNNPVLHFELRKETAKLNPMQWVR